MTGLFQGYIFAGQGQRKHEPIGLAMLPRKRFKSLTRHSRLGKEEVKAKRKLM